MHRIETWNSREAQVSFVSFGAQFLVIKGWPSQKVFVQKHLQDDHRKRPENNIQPVFKDIKYQMCIHQSESRCDIFGGLRPTT